MAAKVVHGLSGPAGTVTLGLAQPVQPWFTRHGLKLFALQIPVGEVRGHGRREGGDEAVGLVVAEREVGIGMQRGGNLLKIVRNSGRSPGEAVGIKAGRAVSGIGEFLGEVEAVASRGGRLRVGAWAGQGTLGAGTPISAGPALCGQ